MTSRRWSISCAISSPRPAPAPRRLELVHFGCTSEDINNLSYARLLRAARGAVLLPELRSADGALRALARAHAGLPMLARTHGQSASPTTFGKEMANVGARLARALQRLAGGGRSWPNGTARSATTTRTTSARPEIDWLELSREFIVVAAAELESLQHPDRTARLDRRVLRCLRRRQRHPDRPVPRYLGLHLARLPAPAARCPGEVGSSTMPHKVNPIDFENAEGNFGMANAMLRFFADKLPISRWQRDLTDSTVLRNLGVALAHGLIGWKRTAARTGEARARSGAHGAGSGTAPTRCSPRRSRACCAPPASPTATNC